jgi:hypothetical protein
MAHAADAFSRNPRKVSDIARFIHADVTCSQRLVLVLPLQLPNGEDISGKSAYCNFSWAFLGGDYVFFTQGLNPNKEKM